MKKERKKEIGERIKAFRQKQGFTQEEFSKLANITRIALGNYERGERAPTIEIFERIAKALHVTTDELLGSEQTKLENCLSFCKDYGYTSIPPDIKKVIDSYEKLLVPYLEKYYDPTQYIYFVKNEDYLDLVHQFNLSEELNIKIKKIRKKDVLSMVQAIKLNKGLKILIHDLLKDKIEQLHDLDFNKRQIQDISYFYGVPVPPNVSEIVQNNNAYKTWILETNRKISNKYFQGKEPSKKEWDELNGKIVQKWPKNREKIISQAYAEVKATDIDTATNVLDKDK